MRLVPMKPTNRIPESVFSLDALESKLVSYVNDPSASTTPFDASSIPKISRTQAAAEAARRFPSGTSPFFNSHLHTGPSSLETVGVPAKKEATPVPQLSSMETQSAYIQQLKDVPELSTYGEVLGSSKQTQLTESETEYQVSCVKHVFAEHVVFQVRRSLFVIGWHRMMLTAGPVQCLEHNTGYRPGTSRCCYATFRRVHPYRRFHYPAYVSLISNLSRNCLCFIHPGLSRGVRFWVIPVCAQVHQQGSRSFDW